MEFRRAVSADLNEILEIIRQAQDYFKNKGIDQWQNNYPNEEVINNDIESKKGYVLVDGDIIVGTVSVSFDGEKTYDYIEGEWLSNGDYAVVHRIAVRMDYKGKGLASVILKNIEHMCLKEGIHSIKVDTHEDNRSMQRLLQKNRFTYCGVIYLQDGSKRLAYEKLLI
ncbi:MAG TPA: GNAT family N-acetyltransferase [Thermoclostridium sp.]